MAHVYPLPAEAQHLSDNIIYRHPARLCDIVMKGGVTSGIVYPLAVCELAKTYTFKNVGGTSAGAIAAAATAAAELGRHSDNGGFGRIAGLPRELGAEGRLLSLFQPQPGTRRLFALAMAFIGSKRGRIPRVVAAMVANFPIALLVGALPGLLLLAATLGLQGWRLVVAFICAVLLLVVGVVAGVGLAALRAAFREIPRNFYGLCSGLRGAGAGAGPPLTVWLHDLLNDLAGRPGAKEPLTFGDLWGQPDPQQPRTINLEVVTTCLSHGRPYRIPFDTLSKNNRFFFHPDEFRALFPEDVVGWMEQKARTKENAGKYAPLLPFPDPAALPVVVATRMSLSFPLLISAVPLYAIDSTRKAKEDKVPEQCWFSDGGITSNLPVHFFDAPLPQWPTFAVNLREFHPDRPRLPDECMNSFLPTNNRSGMSAWWYRFERLPRTSPGSMGRPDWWVRLREWLWPSPRRLSRFGRAILDTMQNWRDNAQLVQPGYRDRVVHVGLEADEGGTNLKMTEDVTARLTERGRWAGVTLRDRFAGDGTRATTDGWDNHRWVRYRSTMSVLEAMFRELQRGYTRSVTGERTYDELANRRRGETPSSYTWRRASQRQFAARASRSLVALIAAWTAQNERFAEGAPEPDPELRITPRM